MKANTLVLTLGAAALLTLPHVASANTPATTTTTHTTTQTTAPQTMGQVQPLQISPEKMAAFAKVHQDVEKLNMSYQEKIQKATTPADKTKLAAEANKEMNQIVGKSNISVAEYSQMASLVQRDKNVHEQYLQALKK